MIHRIIIASVAFLVLTSIHVMAYVTVPFHGWADVEAYSPDIVVVYTEGPASYPRGINMSGPKYYYNVVVESVLSGTNNLKSTRILTDHQLEPHRPYLVFARYDADYFNGCFSAFEDYRVIPLEEAFDLHSIEGKPMDKQLQILFKSGIKEMDKKIKEDEAERRQLEEGLQP